MFNPTTETCGLRENVAGRGKHKEEEDGSGVTQMSKVTQTNGVTQTETTINSHAHKAVCIRKWKIT